MGLLISVISGCTRADGLSDLAISTTSLYVDIQPLLRRTRLELGSLLFKADLTDLMIKL